MELPREVKISTNQLEMLRKSQAAGEAIEAMMNAFQAKCQQKLQEAHRTARAAWASIQSEHGIDVQNIQWVPDFDRGVIVPVSMRLVQAPTQVDG